MMDIAGIGKKVKVSPLGLAVLAGVCSTAGAQDASTLPSAPMPSPDVMMKLPGGVVVEHGTPGALPLSLDDAIDRGFKNNLQLKLSRENEVTVHAGVLT